MKIIEPYFEILHMADSEEIMRVLELAARNCYKSEDKIGPGSAEKILKSILRSGHGSILEHISITVRIVCDRGVMAELTRHRAGIGFSIESTRYANYGKKKFGREITVIDPGFWDKNSDIYMEWFESVELSERSYMRLLDQGATPQEARSVLPNSLKTDIVVTANIREWIHVFKLRCSKAAHPQARQTMRPILAEFRRRLPVLFDDIKEQ